MSAPALVWLVVGLCTALILAALLLALVRQVRRLTTSVRRFDSEIQPALRTIRRESARAQERVARLQGEESPLASVRQGRTGGSRSRRQGRR